MINSLVKEVQVKPEMSEIVKLFCDLNSDEMVEFFNGIAEEVKKWKGSFAFQLQYVTDSNELTVEARNIMRTIGEYANESDLLDQRRKDSKGY